MADGSLVESHGIVKLCPRCNQRHPVERFPIKRGKPHGYCSDCNKTYQKEWYAKNADRVKERARGWSSQNRERKAEADRTYRKNNKERCAEKSREWARKNKEKRQQIIHASYLRHKEACDRRSKEWIKANPILVRERSRRLKIARKSASVAWADTGHIIAIYKEAARLQLETGIHHEVDHIVPICGRNVCGLHWEGNLRVVTRRENRRKSNSLIDV